MNMKVRIWREQVGSTLWNHIGPYYHATSLRVNKYESGKQSHGDGSRTFGLWARHIANKESIVFGNFNLVLVDILGVEPSISRIAEMLEVFAWSSGLIASNFTLWGQGHKEWGRVHFLFWKQKKSQGVDSSPLGKRSSGLIPSFEWKRLNLVWSVPPVGLRPRAFLLRLSLDGVPGGEASGFFFV